MKCKNCGQDILEGAIQGNGYYYHCVDFGDCMAEPEEVNNEAGIRQIKEGSEKMMDMLEAEMAIKALQIDIEYLKEEVYKLKNPEVLR